MRTSGHQTPPPSGDQRATPFGGRARSLSRLALAGLALFIGAAGLVWWSRPRAAETDAPVSGRVFLDGQLVADGVVVFHPDASKGNTTSLRPRGRSDRSGNYRLATEGRAGAPPGWYRVTVVIQGDPRKVKGRPPKADPRFGKPETSGLSVLVTPRPDPDAYDLRVAKPGTRR